MPIRNIHIVNASRPFWKLFICLAIVVSRAVKINFTCGLLR